MIRTPLFSEPVEDDHRWYHHMWHAKNGTTAAFYKAFCQKMYDKYHEFLDADFCKQFRKKTPDRFSELFFLNAFVCAGWKPVAAPKKIDFAFVSDFFDGRLLVEVITPITPNDLPIEIDQKTGQKSYSAGSQDRDNAIAKITGAVSTKAVEINKAIDEGNVQPNDYKIVAVSGLNNTQEGVWRFDFEDLPDWVTGFFPIGAPTINLHIPSDRSKPLKNKGLSRAFESAIKRPGKSDIPRNDFLSAKYLNVNAIVFSNVYLNATATHDHLQVSALHNPTSAWEGEKPNLQMQNDFIVNLFDSEFEIDDRNASKKSFTDQ